MSLQSEAQFIEVLDPAMMEPMEVVTMPSCPMDSAEMSPMEVKEPVELEIVVEELPGAPAGTKDPEIIEVTDDKESKDDNEAKSSKKDSKWDWTSNGASGFLTWIKDRLDDVPKHSGYDSAGLERACSYLEKLDNEISKAMRLDVDGELDADKIEEVRSKIDEGLNRLYDRLDKVKKSKKSSRKKKSEFEAELVKEAQKAAGVKGTFVVVPLLISRLGRIIINGLVSAGHDAGDMFKKLSNKYKLNDREQAELMQYLADSGFPMREDRGYMLDEEVDLSSSDNFDWAANYRG